MKKIIKYILNRIQINILIQQQVNFQIYNYKHYHKKKNYKRIIILK